MYLEMSGYGEVNGGGACHTQLVGAGSLFHRVTVTVDNTAPYLLPVSSLVLFYPARN